MSEDLLRYDLMIEAALRDVVRETMETVARDGLPGDHHFYITFLTKFPGVKVPESLRKQYPEEMTVILQHQFWDLVVTEDRFEVGLSFGGIPERLVVPFTAIKSFFDPSVPFTLAFEPSEVAAEPPAKTLPAVPAPSALPAPAPVPATENQADPTKPGEGAEVVRLDRFRKK